MSRTATHLFFLLTIGIFLFSSGCSTAGKESVPFNSRTGKHRAGWLPLSHSRMAAAGGAAVDGNLSAINCASCHGEDLGGGISGISCTGCHLGDATHVHPASWNPVYRDHGLYATTNGTTACSNGYCHGTALEGVANSGPSCTSCHLGDPTHVHPAAWNPVYNNHDDYARSNGTAACENRYCHGSPLTGVPDSGPSCTTCHIGDATHVHPATWDPVYRDHGPYAKAGGTGGCENQYCHGPELTGVPGSGPSCTSCHLGDTLHIHPTAWTSVPRDHGPFAKANGAASCANQSCHGPELTGVPDSGPSCTSCHLGGTTQPHPAEWTVISLNHGPYAAAKGTTSCANGNCHGATLGGVAEGGPSCTSCHIGGPASPHPADWAHISKDHGPYAKENGTESCSNLACHGATLGGVQNSGPSCTTCHSMPFLRSTIVCSECHGYPPAGDASPNRAGKHANHMALGSYVICDTCHSGAGGGTANDYHLMGTPVVGFASFASASSGAAAFDADTKTCSNISCHGGPRTQTQEQADLEWNSPLSPATSAKNATPAWYSGIIEVNTQCKSCHVYGAAEYNSYGSGQHYPHVWKLSGPKLECTVCHSPAKLAQSHFFKLDTPALEGPASDTLDDALQYIKGVTPIPPSCNPQTGGLTGCHDKKNW